MGSRGELLFVVALLVAQLVFLADQVQGGGDQGTLLRQAGSWVLAPFASAVDGIARAGEAVALGWRDRQRLSADNERLREELERLRRESAARYGAQLELRRLHEALGYQPPEGRTVHVANVVYANHRDLYRRLVVRALDDQGAATLLSRAAVVTEDGLVGRVVYATPPWAEVQLLTDRSSSIGVMVQRTRRQGLLRGGGASLSLDYLPLQADVRVGDRIVTAGIDGIYPRGVRVGTVTSVEPGDELFHRVRVTPAVDMGRLDQVFLLGVETPPEELLDSEVQVDPVPSSTREQMP